MKKYLFLLFSIIFVFCLVGCGEEIDHFDDIEKEYSLENNKLQCFKTEDNKHYRILTYQDPETFAIKRQSLTIYYSQIIEDLDDVDVQKEYCAEYDESKFSKCEADKYLVGLEKDNYNVRIRYTYKLLEDNPDKDKSLLGEIKELLEKDNYKCDLFENE